VAVMWLQIHNFARGYVCVVDCVMTGRTDTASGLVRGVVPVYQVGSAWLSGARALARTLHVAPTFCWIGGHSVSVLFPES